MARVEWPIRPHSPSALGQIGVASQPSRDQRLVIMSIGFMMNEGRVIQMLRVYLSLFIVWAKFFFSSEL